MEVYCKVNPLLRENHLFKFALDLVSTKSAVVEIIQANEKVYLYVTMYICVFVLYV